MARSLSARLAKMAAPKKKLVKNNPVVFLFFFQLCVCKV